MNATSRPRHLRADYASQFADADVPRAYMHRPPYPDEAIQIVVDLIGARQRHVLELGAGPGDFTAPLACRVDHITAVEPADAMRALGEQRTALVRSKVEWCDRSTETFTSARTFSVIVAAESFHWMEWDLVLPRVASRLAPEGLLILVERGFAAAPPWEPELRALIPRFSTNRHYRPLDLTAELERRGLFRLAGQRETTAEVFTQPVSAYVESFHSRNGFSRARMSSWAASAFDAELEALVSPHATNGVVSLQAMATLWWGHVTIGSP